MAISVRTVFSQIYLSAMLPDTVTFYTQDDTASANVTLYVNSAPIFRTTLYPYERVMNLKDIRSIIEGQLHKDNIASAECYIAIYDQFSHANTQTFYVIASDYAIPSPAHFLSTHFLTTRNSFRIHRKGKQNLSWFVPSYARVSYYTEALILPDGQVSPVLLRRDEGTTPNYMGAVYREEISVQTVAEQFERTFPNSRGKLLSFTVHRGNRAMTFYVTDEKPDFHLVFYNTFNVTEYAEFYATTTQKQKVQRSEALCNNIRTQYDQFTEHSFDVETAAVPYEEALWINQIFSSRFVSIPIYLDTYVEILITESTSEISDSDKEQNRLKFSYKYAKNVLHKYVNFAPSYFTEEFSKQFM